LFYYNSVDPEVSIIILNLNKPDMTVECLESIWENTSGATYEVIVVDNGSRKEEYLSLVRYEGPHTLIRLEVNRFFGEGNNIGAEAAKGKYLLFLNNDVVVTKWWLEPLIHTIRTEPNAGCCGPKFVYPDGQLQEAGALLDQDGNSVQIGKFQSPDQPRFNKMREVDYVSAAAVLMRKADFESVLGFDFRYEPAYYEDCDLCLKIATLGKSVYFVPESTVIHYENATTSDPSNGLRLSTIVDLNRRKFVKRWASFLESGRHDGRHFTGRIVPANAPNGRRAGFYTPYNINPGGGERYLLGVIEVFSRLGFAPTLIVPERFSRIRISSVLKSLSLELPSLDIVTYAEAVNGEPYDVFFALGNEICPSSPGLGVRNIYCCQVPFKSAPEELERRLPWLARYDAIVCYSEFVEAFIREQLAGTAFERMTVEVLYPSVGLVSGASEGERAGILAIGRFFTGGHCKRQDMMIEAVDDLVSRGNNVVLHLVGSLPPEPEHRAYLEDCLKRAEGLPVQFHVDAAPEEVEDLLASSSVYWHGAGFGVDPAERPDQCEHFGISVVEAMSARVVPVVVNNGGPASIVEDGVSGFHYGDRDQLVSLTEALLNADAVELDRLRGRAYDRAQHYSYAAFRQRWTAFAEDLLMRTPAAAEAGSAS
jgi:GT2 family glycosyltransferase